MLLECSVPFSSLGGDSHASSTGVQALVLVSFREAWLDALRLGMHNTVFETSARVHHMIRWMCQMFILGMKKDAGFLTSDEPIFLSH